MPVSTTATPSRAGAGRRRCAAGRRPRAGAGRRRRCVVEHEPAGRGRAAGARPPARPRCRAPVAPGAGEPHGQRDLVVEPPREAVGEAVGDVLDDEDRDREAGGDLGEHGGERLRAARRGADPDDRGGTRPAVAGASGVRARGLGPPRGWRITRTRLSSFTRRRKARARRRRDRADRGRPWRSASSAPAASEARAVPEPLRAPPERTRIGTGWTLMICSIASPPDMPGSSRSIVTRCGFGSSCDSRAIVSSALGAHADHLDLRVAPEQPRQRRRVGAGSPRRSARGGPRARRGAHRPDEPLDRLEQVVLVEACASRCRRRRRRRSRACGRPSSPSEVTITTGSAEQVACARIACVSSMPSISGISTSVTTRSISVVAVEMRAARRGRRARSARDSRRPRGCCAAARGS